MGRAQKRRALRCRGPGPAHRYLPGSSETMGTPQGSPRPWPLAPKRFHNQGWTQTQRKAGNFSANLWGARFLLNPVFQHAATFGFHQEASKEPALPGAHRPIHVLGLTGLSQIYTERTRDPAWTHRRPRM